MSNRAQTTRTIPTAERNYELKEHCRMNSNLPRQSHLQSLLRLDAQSRKNAFVNKKSLHSTIFMASNPSIMTELIDLRNVKIITIFNRLFDDNKKTR